ncbi:MAG: phosphate ABC transporter substrate-binding/OmpA family protein, partial [Pseudomonadota bacterium]
EEGSASYDFFSEYLYGEEVPQFLPAGIAADDQALSNAIYHDKNAIGYLGYAFQRGAKPMTLVNECGIATTPDAFSAKTEEYALNRRMYLYNRADTLDPQGRAFLDFVTSDEADGVIGKSGFIDLGITRRAQSLEEGRGASLKAEVASYDAGFEAEVMEEMLTKMGDYGRLSTTFRFRTGSSKVDERGKLDMKRLINFLEGEDDGTTVSIVGFTDDVGAFEANRRLSLGRADTVADLLKGEANGRIDHINLQVAGFGEVAPSACNVTDRGRSINRRVEVWIESGQQS